MAYGIGRLQILGKQNRKQSGMSTNILTVPVSISKCHNTKDNFFYMKLNSLSTNTNDAVHEKPADTIEKESANNSKNHKN